MLQNDPTYLGRIESVSGSAVTVRVSRSVASGLSIINGKTYRVGQFGSFVRILQGYQDLFGIISEVGASAAPQNASLAEDDTSRWLRVQLVGEAVGRAFDRGISQYPNIGDGAHLVIEQDLKRIYGVDANGHISVGTLSSAENIEVKLKLDALITRHSAVLGSTGSGKSTTIASLLRSIAAPKDGDPTYPSARILLIDIHGEYAPALPDIAQVFSVNGATNETELRIPYWALDTKDLLDFLVGSVSGNQETAFLDRIYQLKVDSHQAHNFAGIDAASITVDTPIPFSLHQLWYQLVDAEVMTYSDIQRSQPAFVKAGDPMKLVAPLYQPHGAGSQAPFINAQAPGVKRQLSLLRSRLLDRRYDFLLNPGEWAPDLAGKCESDLDVLLSGWLGGPKPITILDLSGVPSIVLERLVGSILKIAYESLYWSREKTEGGVMRPLLVVMEEAHRYLHGKSSNLASDVVQKIAKEGRKYGIGAMVVSQRPSEVDETILSQCGTVFAMRLQNADDRARVQGTLPDALSGLMDTLPVLRTGEAIITGEAASMPMRCRITLPDEKYRPRSRDPEVSEEWSLARRSEGYDRVVASWRSQRPTALVRHPVITRKKIPESEA